MYKKTIRFKDYHGLEREDTYEFNLSDSEIMELEAEYEGSITQMIEKLSHKDAPGEITRTLKRIVLMSYGVISDDGIRFEKSEELRTAFYQTEAYSSLIKELASDGQASAKFFEYIISNDIHRDT